MKEEEYISDEEYLRIMNKYLKRITIASYTAIAISIPVIGIGLLKLLGLI